MLRCVRFRIKVKFVDHPVSTSAEERSVCVCYFAVAQTANKCKQQVHKIIGNYKIHFQPLNIYLILANNVVHLLVDSDLQ
jgi:hypothetical protein